MSTFAQLSRHALRSIVAFAIAAAVSVESARADLSLPGPFLVSKRSVTVPRPGGSTFSAFLYYPATSSAASAPLDASGAPYAGLSFGHGFVQAADAYESLHRHLASYGYFVIASTSEGSLFPSHQNFADDLRSCLDWFEAQNVLVGGAYFGAIDTAKLGLYGHSMGGGASILAASGDARVQALAPLAPAETNPSAISAMAGVAAPCRLICGSQDSTVPTSSNGQLMYAAGDAPKQIQSILGGYHCGFVDNPSFGGLGCDSGSITKEQQLTITRRLLASFFNLYLKGDPSVWTDVWGPPLALDTTTITTFDAGVRFNPAGQRQSGFADQVLDFPFTVVNQGPTATSYALFAQNNLWSTVVSPAQTGLLAPGGSEVIHVYVTIPATSAFPTDRALVSARSDLDGSTRGYARMLSRRL